MRYISLDYYSYALIIEASMLEEAKGLLNDLIEGIDIEEKYDVRIAISECQLGLSAIPSGFEQSRRILEYKYLYHQRTIMTTEQIERLHQTTYYYPLRMENQLIHGVLAGDIVALKLFAELFYSNEINNQLKPETFKNLVFAVIGTVGRIIQELKVSSDEFLPKDKDLSALSARWSDEAIIEDMLAILTGLTHYVRDKKENSESEMAKEMLTYVQNNYTDDIMLVDLATKLNVSEKYCGILFKKVVGQNYKSYLNTFRIEQAKEIIYKDPEVKVSDLAKWVGFNSSNSFIRVFTKQIGMTPKRYSEEYVKNRKLKR